MRNRESIPDNTAHFQASACFSYIPQSLCILVIRAVRDYKARFTVMEIFLSSQHRNSSKRRVVKAKAPELKV